MVQVVTRPAIMPGGLPAGAGGLAVGLPPGTGLPPGLPFPGLVQAPPGTIIQHQQHQQQQQIPLNTVFVSQAQVPNVDSANFEIFLQKLPFL